MPQEAFKVALVGRPNVGKSTLFNALTGARDAIVADAPGVTRDRRVGAVACDNRRWLLIDTGGFARRAGELSAQIARQVEHAVGEADLVCFVVDAGAGRVAGDEAVAQLLRRSDKPFWLIVNKADTVDARAAAAEFAAFGVATQFVVSAARRHGVSVLRAALAEVAPPAQESASAEVARAAFIGRPNAGKSSLMNRLLGAPRLVVDAAAGTTRDSITETLRAGGRTFMLTDTAGLARRADAADPATAAGAAQTAESVLLSHVAVLVCDASQGFARQDLALAARARERGRAVVVAANKIDLCDAARRAAFKREAAVGLRAMPNVAVMQTSARTGAGVAAMPRRIWEAYASAGRRLNTARCTQLLRRALERHPPPTGTRAKPRYAHQSGSHPLRITVHGGRVELLPATYRRYLANFIARELGLVGAPVALDFSATPNPYASPSVNCATAHRSSRRRPRGRTHRGTMRRSSQRRPRGRTHRATTRRSSRRRPRGRTHRATTRRPSQRRPRARTHRAATRRPSRGRPRPSRRRREQPARRRAN